jgi:hypothetical protein
MVQRAQLIELEMRCLEGMTRPQLVEALRALGDCLPEDLRERLEEHETDCLQVLLFAARFIHALRRMQQTRDFGAKAAGPSPPEVGPT